MTEHRDPLAERLRAMADAMDDQALPVTADEAIGGAKPDPARGRRSPLVVAAAAIVLLAGSVAWALGGGDEETSVVTPGPDLPETTTTTVPSTTLVPGIGWDSLPSVGIAVQPIDGPLRLFDLDGSALGLAAALPGAVNGPRLVAWPDYFDEDLDDMAEVPSGCESAAGGGGLRVALCGGGELPRRIDLVDSAGEATVLVDGLPTPDGSTEPVLGHWRWATPSPDGRWVLAQWSGECEIPTAFVIEVATGELRTVDGTAGAAWASAPESTGIGWAPDGRAVVVLHEGVCGTGAEEPGTHLLDAATGTLELVVPAGDSSDQVYIWTKRAEGNEPGWLLNAAVRSLGLDRCCGEPPHGGPGVTGGAIFEGQNIGISAYPSQHLASQLPVTESQRLPLLGGEATVASLSDGGQVPGPRVVGFTCGEFTWWLSWWDEGTPEVDSMLMLAEALVPHLACTLREAPG